jgi:signal transduction histidine kinase
MSLLSRRPDPAFVVDVLVSCSVAALATSWWHQFRPGGLAYGGLVGVALLARRRRPLTVLAVVAALSAAVAPIEVGGTEMHEGMLLVSLGAAGYAVVAHALTARIVRQQRVTAADRRAAAERERAHLIRLAVAEERATIARELHDIVAHSLSVMILQANGGEYALDHDAERTRTALRAISATGNDALEEIRHLVQVLRGVRPRSPG